MDYTLAKALVATLEEEGEAGYIYENYSGRGMYGVRTTGVVCDSLAHLLTAVIANPSFIAHSDGDGGLNATPVFDPDPLRFDHLGRDIIVY